MSAHCEKHPSQFSRGKPVTIQTLFKDIRFTAAHGTLPPASALSILLDEYTSTITNELPAVVHVRNVCC